MHQIFRSRHKLFENDNYGCLIILSKFLYGTETRKTEKEDDRVLKVYYPRLPPQPVK